MKLKLNLSPVRSDDPRPSVTWQGPVLTLDGASYDLSLLGDGDTAQHPVLGKVSRAGDNYECTLCLSHGANAPYETRFPEPLVLTTNGEVTLPLYNNPEMGVEDELAE